MKSAVFKELNQVKTLVQKISDEIRKTEELFQEDIKTVDSAKKNVEEAANRDDFEAYHRQKNTLRVAEDRLEMHQRKLNKLKNEPSIAEEEFWRHDALIRKAAHEAELETVAKVIPLLDQIKQMTDELFEVQNAANEALNLWRSNAPKKSNPVSALLLNGLLFCRALYNPMAVQNWKDQIRDSKQE